MAYVSSALAVSKEARPAHDKRLSIRLRDDGFSFAETTVSGELLALGEAEGRHAQTMTEVGADVKAFFSGIGIKPLGYASAELVVMADEHVWVPDELFVPTSARQYLKVAGGRGATAMTCECKSIGSTSVYAANEPLVRAFKVAVPGLVVVNQHAKLVQLLPRAASHPMLVTHWRSGWVDIAAFRGGHYVYGNALRFGSEAEALFHTLEVMKACKIEGERAELLMCGDVDRERYLRFRPYFPTAGLCSGNVNKPSDPDFRTLPTYRNALILI